MRIIGGKHRGRKLAEFAGDDIRPTSDRAKVSLFNILSPELYGSSVLDLFCGSGGLGLESLSRGAAFVHFNDASADSLKVLKKNIDAIGETAYTVTNRDFADCLKTIDRSFDIIFLDPPYRFDYGAPALKLIAERKLLTDDGVAVYERDRSFSGQVEGLEMYDERKYGKAYLTFFRYRCI